ncbi:MAG: prolyl oligopeptidase family protein [Sphingomonadales bacterium]
MAHGSGFGWRGLIMVSLGGLVVGCSDQSANDDHATSAALKPVAYPAAHAADHTDDYFGVPVADPYRWLEALDSPETKAWIKDQNGVSEPYLADLPARTRIEERLKSLWNYERFGIPAKEGGKYFYVRNDGLQDQDVLYVAADIDAEPRELINPNEFSGDRTASLHSHSVSPDAAHISYAVSESGSDWTDIRVRNVETGRDLADNLTFIKFGGYNVAWDHDGQGFYYSRYPKGEDGKGDGKGSVKLYHHKLGTSQDDDALVYAMPDHPSRIPAAGISEDGRYLIVSVFEGYFSNAIYFKDLSDDTAEITALIDSWDGEYEFLGNSGAEFYFSTTSNAPRGRVIAVDVGDPAPANWREVVPQAEQVLRSARFIGGRFVASYLKDAKAEVMIYDIAGRLVRGVALPGIGSVSGFTGHGDDPETFYAFTSYNTPASIYRYDVATGEQSLFRKPETGFDSTAYTTEQVFYESKDGTRVPMFITYRNGLELNGDNPTLLYGYGGFNISLTPGYSTANIVWLEMGGVLAIPNLRGGGEYGEDWHKAGANLNKQNVFDDFISAAEWLIEHKYTSTPRLAIHGRSNGGLLVAAVMVQRPDLFGAAAPAVGVLDMLRYHTASANARNWKDDYGLSENEAEFHAQLAYSPYHNLGDGVCYPPSIVTTADHDDRVVPWHSFKFAARLQQKQGCDNPVLIRVETRAGHGAGMPTGMRIEDIANRWAFLAAAIGLEPNPGH